MVIEPSGSITVYDDVSVGDYDGSDDTLVGVVNNSVAPVTAITVSGPGSDLAGLDGDGLCTYITCTWSAPTGYEGPMNGFTIDASNSDSAEVDFSSGGLAPGAATYFSLEGALTAATITAREGTLTGNSLDLASWSAGDVHVHSVGDASLRDNLICRQKNLIPTGGFVSPAQETACAQELIHEVTDQAVKSGLSWLVLSEHGPWLGVEAPGRSLQDILNYSASEGKSEWDLLRDTASSRSSTSGVRLLMGEELGTAPPELFCHRVPAKGVPSWLHITVPSCYVSGHTSAYYTPEYIPDSPLQASEGALLNSQAQAGAWGGINHPGTGSPWHCWVSTDRGDCPDGVATDFTNVVHAVEIYTSAVQPLSSVLGRWDGLLSHGSHVAAVGGGDVHTVSRVGAWPLSTSMGDQAAGNLSALGTPGRARTYALASSTPPATGYHSDDAADPIRTAIKHGV